MFEIKRQTMSFTEELTEPRNDNLIDQVKRDFVDIGKDFAEIRNDLNEIGMLSQTMQDISAKIDKVIELLENVSTIPEE